MYDTWVEAMDRGEATGVCFLDMTAEFDMVKPSILLKKLGLYGFDVTAITWIESYLSDRKQTVCIDGTFSRLLFLIQSDAARRTNPTFTVELNTGSELLRVRNY